MNGVSPEELARWKAGSMRFLQTITVRADKPIVLKSPPHTARVWACWPRCFPAAKFVHIVRDPFTCSLDDAALAVALDPAGADSDRDTTVCRNTSSAASSECIEPSQQKTSHTDGKFLRTSLRRFGARSACANGNDLRPFATRRLRAGAAEDRGLYAIAEGLPNKPPSNLARNDGRDFPPLGPFHAAIRLRLRTGCRPC